MMPCTTGPRAATMAVRRTVARRFWCVVPSPFLKRNNATMAATQVFFAFLKAQQVWTLQRLVQALVVEIGAPGAPALRGRGAEF